MPTFRFKGFTTASAVALTLTQGAASDTLTTNSWGDAGGITPTASFTIEVVGGLSSAHAPHSVVVRAQDISGFAVAEPSFGTTEAERNVYDPTQHKITWVWNFGDTAYTPVTSVNIPNVWRDSNIAYGRQAGHCYHNDGTYTITCFAFDEEGNWATAELTIPAISSRETAFPAASTVCLSFEGNFTGAPAGIPSNNLVTTFSAAQSRLNTIANGGNKPRLLYRYGEDYENHPRLNWSGNTASAGLYVSAYGNSADGFPILRPNPAEIRALASNAQNFVNHSSGMACTYENIRFQGPWDGATETGPSLEFNRIFYSSNLLFHRCIVDGFEKILLGTEGGSGGDHFLSDTRVSNNRKFTAYANSTRDAISRLCAVNCDFSNKTDALSGCEVEGSNPDGFNFGNQHGVRFAGFYELYIGCSSFFTRVGWSLSNPTSGTDFPPTTLQPALRLSYVSTMNNFRFFNVLDRCSFEGGDDMMRFTPVETSQNFNWNMVIDKCLFVGCAQTASFINSNYNGETWRNCLFYLPDTPYQRNGTRFSGRLIYFDDNIVVPGAVAPIEFYSNTVIIAADSANLGGASPSSLQIGAATDIVLNQANNIFYAPNTDTTLNPGFATLGSTSIAGFTPRYLGTRWNFIPLGIDGGPQAGVTVGQARQAETGIAGSVLDGEWVRFPWPDYTDYCNGALNTPLASNTFRELVLANSTQRHEVSVNNEPEIMWRGGDSSLSSDMDGRVTFDFSNASYFRVRNNSGVTWPSDRRIAVKWDLSDYLMDFKPGTATPDVVPLATPASDSDAYNAYTSGLHAWDDFSLTVRSGRVNKVGVTVSGTDDLGAFAAS